MKSLKTYFASTIFMVVSTLVFSQASINGELKKWHTITILFDGPTSSEDAVINPFLDYRLNVTFTAPNGSTFLVPGFFAADGNAAETSATSGNKWIARFTPNQIGVWSYMTSFRSGTNISINTSPNAGSSTGFDGTTGNFTIVQNDKKLPDNRAKGRLNYVGERYLKFEQTNTYFLKAGSDSPENLLAYNDFDNTVSSKNWSPHAPDWNAGDASWQGGKGKELIGAINYLADKGMNAFSFLTMNIKGDGKDVWPYSATTNNNLDNDTGSDAENRLRFDVSKLEQWEILFSHADKKGMYLHFKTQETENDQLLDNGNLGTQRKLYYRELIARFGHHLALNWNIGEENTQTTQQQKECAVFFRDNDPYRHHIVIHTYPNQQTSIYPKLLGSQSEYTGPSIQTDINNVHRDVKKWILDSKASGKQWVVANDEQGNAQTGVAADAAYSGSKGNRDDNRKATRHRVLWGTLMAGGAGVEYYFGYGTGETDLTAQNLRSRDTKWDDAKIALDFFMGNLSYWEMETNDGLTSDNDAYCFAKKGQVYAIYLPQGGSTNLNLSTVTGDFSVQWYNPSTGGNLMTGSVSMIRGGANRNIGSPPNNNASDWVVLIKKLEGDVEDEDNGNNDEGCASEYVEKDGLVIIEAENTKSDYDLWQLKTDVTDYKGSGHLEFTGNNTSSGPARSPLTYTFKIEQGGLYQLTIRGRKRITAPDESDKSNDCYVRVEGNYGAGPNAGNSHQDDAPKSALESDMKIYGGNTDSWGWASTLDLGGESNKRSPKYLFKAGETYTFVMSGRAKQFNVDRIVFYRLEDYNGTQARNAQNTIDETICDNESTDTCSNIQINAITDFRNTEISGFSPAYLDETRDALAIDASIYKDKYAAASTTFSGVSGKYDITLHTLTELDGESSYRIKINGVQVGATFQNPTTGTDYVPAAITFDKINVSNGDAIQVEFNSHTNGLIPEGDGTAFSRGRWTSLDFKCSDGDSENIPVTKVSVTPNELKMIAGDLAQLTATVSPSDATDTSIIWNSSDKTIVTIDTNGKITAIAIGEATITVTTKDGNHKATSSITVEAEEDIVSVTGVSISPGTFTLNVGEKKLFNAEISPATAANKIIAWSSSDTEIVSINSNGEITALKEGTATIMAKTQDGGFESTAVITVEEEGNIISVTGIRTDSITVTLQLGETFSINAIVTPANATNTSVTWESEFNEIATVDDNGLITPLDFGTVIITITTIDGAYTSKIEVIVQEPFLDDGKDENLIIYPNPAKSGSKIFLTGMKNGTYSIMMISLAGAIQKTATVEVLNEDFELTLPVATKGTYILLAQSLENSYSTKVLIQ